MVCKVGVVFFSSGIHSLGIQGIGSFELSCDDINSGSQSGPHHHNLLTDSSLRDIPLEEKVSRICLA